jgi:hypothetical protein
MFVMIAKRPNLATVVGAVNQFMHKPQMDHWQVIKRILRYLQGTKDYWFQYKAMDDMAIWGFYDACKLGWRFTNKEINYRLCLPSKQ